MECWSLGREPQPPAQQASTGHALPSAAAQEHVPAKGCHPACIQAVPRDISWSPVLSARARSELVLSPLSLASIVTLSGSHVFPGEIVAMSGLGSALAVAMVVAVRADSTSVTRAAANTYRWRGIQSVRLLTAAAIGVPRAGGPPDGQRDARRQAPSDPSRGPRIPMPRAAWSGRTIRAGERGGVCKRNGLARSAARSDALCRRISVAGAAARGRRATARCRRGDGSIEVAQGRRLEVPQGRGLGAARSAARCRRGGG